MRDILDIRLNLDDLNALLASLFTDSDCALAFRGLVLGVNGGECPDHSSKVLRESFEAGSRWRREAEEKKEKYKSGGAKSASIRLIRYGSAQPMKAPELPLELEPELGVEGSSTIPRSTFESVSRTSFEKTPKVVRQEMMLDDPDSVAIVTTSSSKQRKSKTTKPTNGVKIADILATDGTEAGNNLSHNYWHLAGLWEAEKNPAPKESATLYRKLYDQGCDLNRVHEGAVKYREIHIKKKELQYMTSLTKWLENEGWENVLRNGD